MKGFPGSSNVEASREDTVLARKSRKIAKNGRNIGDFR